jgi:alkaline phosphatase
MGRVQESVAEMYLGRRLSWSDAPYQTQVKTKSTERVTDSAASAIAMATESKQRCYFKISTRKWKCHFHIAGILSTFTKQKNCYCHQH